ncbi:MAG: energy-coupling factor transporter ATPase [Eubacteriales bacterium]|nr:energy-coupling factor transporter ATPase [Eubacteriales bacterium]
MIELNRAGYVYKEGGPFERNALEEATMQINKGEFVGIIGHTGSGKSTMIQLMNALLLPTSGTVTVDGQVTTDKSTKLRDIRFKVGMVFQYPEHQIFEETVRAEISFGPRNQGLSGQELEDRVNQAMEMVHIPQKWSELSPFELSGGQKRRVAIASILAIRPQVLILDEPTAGLDPASRDKLLKEVRNMRDNLGITVVFITHSMEDIADIADRIIAMDKGRVKFDGTPQEVFSHMEELDKMGLSVPEVTRLTARLGLPLCFTVKQAKAVINKELEKHNA